MLKSRFIKFGTALIITSVLFTGCGQKTEKKEAQKTENVEKKKVELVSHKSLDGFFEIQTPKEWKESKDFKNEGIMGVTTDSTDETGAFLIGFDKKEIGEETTLEDFAKFAQEQGLLPETVKFEDAKKITLNTYAGLKFDFIDSSEGSKDRMIMTIVDAGSHFGMLFYGTGESKFNEYKDSFDLVENSLKLVNK